MAPVIKELKNNHKFTIKTCVTAQHREMLDQVLEFFDIEPEYDLNLMKENQSINEITSRILVELDNVFEEFLPEYVLVHGDTTTSMAASIAAFYKKIKIGHVEAGLRTHNLYSPYPEEANRQIISVLSHINFVPTKESKENLLKENKNNIYITGNTVIDALFHTTKKFSTDAKLIERIESQLSQQYSIQENKFILVTGHRRENFGKGFINICNAIKHIADRHQDIDIVYPVHLNPNVREPVNQLLSGLKNVFLIEPLSYEVFVYLMQKSYFILTDSGGIQEEAPSLGKPVLVMRDTSERPEAIIAGTAKLVGTEVNKIVKEAENLLKNKESYLKMSQAHNPYGDGFSSNRIMESIIKDSSK
jgi:UDP-N-acetylglucosamine 2-epimerase (non-hydrolysing)